MVWMVRRREKATTFRSFKRSFGSWTTSIPIQIRLESFRDSDLLEPSPPSTCMVPLGRGRKCASMSIDNISSMSCSTLLISYFHFRMVSWPQRNSRAPTPNIHRFNQARDPRLATLNQLTSKPYRDCMGKLAASLAM
jgi:hypothetical protein